MKVCKACGSENGDDAVLCEKCGAALVVAAGTTQEEEKPAKKKISVFKIIKFAIVGVFLLIAILTIPRLLDPYNNILNIDNMRLAYAYAQEVVSDTLLSPSSAVYPDFKPDFVTQHPEKTTYEGEDYDVYTVTAYVDSDSVLGVSIRANFEVRIGLKTGSNKDEYIYEIVSLE